ncbi:MAG: TonB-dependent receptor [Bacteroidales bacterium]|nr:TonB-dependent receptor [Bacteroidales bacterium]
MRKHYLAAIGILTVLIVELFCANNALAQNRKISGVVIDKTEYPVPGASVIVTNNSKIGTVTDADGNFSFEVPQNASLTVSCIGYKDVVVATAGKDFLNIVLEEDSEFLEETVVVGYGTQRKKLITGSTVNVTSEKLAAVNAIDALGALQSQAAGVNIVSNSGQPGESYKVTIRGMGTIGDAEPLYVIDGVPGGSITALSPNDIESIDVLKDAASSAIYGARASNGVILVTTKQGKEGKVHVSYDGYVGFQNPNTNGVTPLNAKQYMEINTLAYEIQGTTPYDFQSLIPKQYAQIQNGTWNGTNWLEEMTIHNAPIANQSINITGGSDVSRFALGFTYFNQNGTIGYPANPKYDRYTVRINSDYSLWKKNGRDIIKFGENVTFTTTNKTGIDIGGIYGNSIRDLLTATPLLPAYNEAGGFYEYKDMVADNWDFNQDFSNPLAETQYKHGNKNTKAFRIQANAFLEINPIRGLKFKSNAGWNYYHSEYRSYVPVYTLSAKTSNPTDDVNQNQNYSTRWTWENTLNYIKSWGDNNFDFLIGQSLEKWGYGSSVGVKNSNSLFPDYLHAYIDNTQGLDVANTSISGAPHSQGALSSFFGRVNYNYKEKYLVSAVIRADGSSNFARGHRWGYFPSVSAGWVISNEPWMAETSNWLSFLKLRGSWGQNGNCNISNFQYLATVSFEAPYYFNDKDLPQTGAYPDILPNENVKWETSEQLDFGFDARFFRSRLGFSFDWYNKMTKDWLVVAPTLLSYGTGAPYVNGGDIRNRGYEMLLSWNDSPSRDFSYGASLTFSHNSNEVVRLANSEGIIHGPENAIAQNTTELYRVQVGYPIGYFWGYKMDGIMQNEADVKQYLADNCGGDAANSLQGSSIQPGDVKFVDVNRDGKITKDDKTMIGSPHPSYNLGISFNIAWKGFDFAVNGYGAFGLQVAKSYRQFSDHPDNNYCTDVYTKYWTGEGSTNRYPRFTDGKNVNMSELSKVWVEDADYFKVQNITLGYDFNKLFKWKAVSRFRAYVSAQNMLTFTNYSGMDPEVGFGNGASWASGIDVGNYPSSNAWIFGLNINF